MDEFKRPSNLTFGSIVQTDLHVGVLCSDILCTGLKM